MKNTLLNQLFTAGIAGIATLATDFGVRGAHAQVVPDLPSSIATSVISANALGNVQGRAAVNIVAGDSNAQSNNAAMAAGLGVTSVHAYTGIYQTMDPRQANALGVARAVIGDQAFANAAGMVSVNQASGVSNAQANTAAIGLGFEANVVAESTLAVTTSGMAPIGPGSASARVRGVSISDTAFQGARGLVQVNQSAGSGNSTANTFALKANVGVKP